MTAAPTPAGGGMLGGRAALGALEDLVDLDARPLLVISDFDGTLSPIVADPWGARIIPAAGRALRRLAALDGVAVALLSGRTARDLAQRVRVGRIRYLGNHGIERATLPRGGRVAALRVDEDPHDAGIAAAVERATLAVEARVPERWLIVERKPPAVAFHYRQAPDVAAAGRAVAAAVDEADPGRLFERFPGRRVLELRPPGARAKGDAVDALVEEIRPAVTLVLGDDRTDLLAFAALAALRTRRVTDGAALAVLAHAEAPPEVMAGADLVLGSPREAARFLSALAERASR